MPIFSDPERRAWQWPDELAPSQWSARYRVLPPTINAEPGPFSNDRAPYQAGLIDAAIEPGVEEIVFVKSAQIGGSEAFRNLIGYWIDQDPGPLLCVLPSEQACKEYFAERIMPMLESSPALKRHLSTRKWDTKVSSILLDSMPIFGGWSGSPTTLASRPIRYVLFDEVDKFPPFSGREADPISLGSERTATYQHRRRIVKLSTPTNRQGAIWKAFEACGDRRHFHVPCPQCGQYQTLDFSQIKWPHLPITDKIELADRIQSDSLAWYECAVCKGRIENSKKPWMLCKGLWVSQTQQAIDGQLVGQRPLSKRVGFHLSVLYSPWRSFAEIAAEFIRCGRDAARIMNFRNSWLAEPFELQVAKTPVSVIRQKCVVASQAGPAGAVPSWARAVIASADTQGSSERDGWFPYVVRAWGYEFRSQLLDYGIASSFQELRDKCLNRVFPRADGEGGVAPQMLLIDTGGPRWSEVYQFAQSDRLRIRPTKGAATALAMMIAKNHQKNHDIVLWTIDTEKAKDLLHRLIHDPDQTKWLPMPAGAGGVVDETYCAQMASEHKILDKKSNTERWVPITQGAANHAWDAETLQCAAAFDLGAGNPEPKAAPQPAAPPPSGGADPREQHRQRFAWLDRRPNLPRPR